MPIEVLSDAFVQINAVDLSDHVESVAINYSAEIKEARVMGDDGVRRLSGLKDWSMTFTMRQDYDASKVDATLQPLVGGSSFAVAVRASKTNAISATNPEYQGNGLIDGDLPVIAGDVGEVHDAAFTIVGADGVALVRDVSP